MYRSCREWRYHLAVNPAATATSILVADDEPMLLRLMERVLVRAGYEVRTAADSDAALKCLHEHGPEIRTVILDALIASGGAAVVVQAIAEKWSDVGLILTSGDSLKQPLQQLMIEYGAIFLRKPFPPEQLPR